MVSNYLFSTDGSTLCNKFDVPHYPYFLIVDEKGDACVYEGGRLPNEILDYLKERKTGKKFEKCRFIGKINTMSRIFGYL